MGLFCWYTASKIINENVLNIFCRPIKGYDAKLTKN